MLDYPLLVSRKFRVETLSSLCSLTEALCDTLSLVSNGTRFKPDTITNKPPNGTWLPKKTRSTVTGHWVAGEALADRLDGNEAN